MSPVTTQQRRTARHADGGRRPGMGRRPAQPATLFDAAPKEALSCAPTRPAAGSDETLDRILVGGWEQLESRATTSCLLCGGTMEPVYGVHPKPIGGRCRDCGTTLS